MVLWIEFKMNQKQVKSPMRPYYVVYKNEKNYVLNILVLKTIPSLKTATEI